MLWCYVQKAPHKSWCLLSSCSRSFNNPSYRQYVLLPRVTPLVMRSLHQPLRQLLVPLLQPQLEEWPAAPTFRHCAKPFQTPQPLQPPLDPPQPEPLNPLQHPLHPLPCTAPDPPPMAFSEAARGPDPALRCREHGELAMEQRSGPRPLHRAPSSQNPLQSCVQWAHRCWEEEWGPRRRRRPAAGDRVGSDRR